MATKNKEQNVGWLKALVNKITKNTESLNNQFEWYKKYMVYAQSGMTDYCSYRVCEIDEDNGREDEILVFSFDYMTSELVLESYSNDYQRVALINSFHSIYHYITVIDESARVSLKDYSDLYEEVIKDKDDYEESYISQLADNINKLKKMRSYNLCPDDEPLQPLIDSDYKWTI